VHLLEDLVLDQTLLGVSLPVFPVFFGSWVLGPVEEGLSLPEIHSRLQQGVWRAGLATSGFCALRACRLPLRWLNFVDFLVQERLQMIAICLEIARFPLWPLIPPRERVQCFLR